MVIFLYVIFCMSALHSNLFVWEKILENFLYGVLCNIFLCVRILVIFCMGKTLTFFLYVIFFACNT